MLLGFALIYAVDRGVAYAPPVRFGEGDLLDAMSLSGMNLTIVGFGDVVAATGVLGSQRCWRRRAAWR